MTEPYPGSATAAPTAPTSAPATSVLRTDPTTSGDRSGSPVSPEKPRQHPIAYIALALGVLSLIWLAVLTSKVGDDGYQKVRVGTQDCVSVPQDNGPAALYCRTSSTG